MSEPMPSWTGEINTETSDVIIPKGAWSPMAPRGLRLSPCRSGAAVDGYQEPAHKRRSVKKWHDICDGEPHFAVELLVANHGRRQPTSTPSSAQHARPTPALI